jgi:hypothetical protein
MLGITFDHPNTNLAKAVVLAGEPRCNLAAAALFYALA